MKQTIEEYRLLYYTAPCSPLKVSRRFGGAIPEDITLHNHRCENFKFYKRNLIDVDVWFNACWKAVRWVERSVWNMSCLSLLWQGRSVSHASVPRPQYRRVHDIFGLNVFARVMRQWGRVQPCLVISQTCASVCLLNSTASILSYFIIFIIHCASLQSSF
jgi:hypothetical protein